MRRIVLLFALSALSLLVLPVAAESAPEFEPDACPMSYSPSLVEGDSINCGYVTVPLRHAEPDGETIRVAVAVFPARTDSPAAPLFMLQGGPGGSALNDFPEILSDLPFGQQMLAERDVVLIEQRGTLHSQPNLICDEYEAFIRENIETVMEPEEGVALSLQAMRDCHERLSADIDLSAFNTSESAADIEAVRAALGYETIHLYGVSYGSQLAQYYAREFPDALDTLILDAVVPISEGFLEQVAVNAQSAFDRFFQTCADHPTCSIMFPDLEDTFYSTVAALNESPDRFRAGDDLENPQNFYDVVLTGDGLINYIFGALYVTDFIPILPFVIEDVAEGDYEILSILSTVFDFDFSLSVGLYYSVICSEIGAVGYDGLSTDNVGPFFQRAFVDYDTIDDICGFWEVAPVSDSAVQPLQTDMPVLLMSGEFDPITPPSFADVVAENLPNGINLMFNAGGHGMFLSECGMAVMADFLENPLATNTACVDEGAMLFD
ncbi:MAG: alpha/beta fold hydrolase [Anaerolineaceae bacterium]|nr:MAG: alpha/beta fold hydrolase [Anaerolineaceae bacterium]